MAISRLNFVNKLGIPALETINATLTTTGETFYFNRHPAFDIYFQGIFLVKVSGSETAPETAVPIYFDSVGSTSTKTQVYNSAGTEITTATWPGDGIYLFFYDKSTDMLRLLTS